MGKAQKLKQQRKEEQAKKRQEERKETLRKILIAVAALVTIALTVFLIMLVNEMKESEDEKAREAGSADSPLVTQQLVLETTKGRIVVGLYGDDAPLNVQHMVELVNQGFYDNLRWYRVEDFVVQTGSHYQSLLAESGEAEPDEARMQEALAQDQGAGTVLDETGVSAVRGRISFAKPSDPQTGSYMANSASTDFFILKTDRTDLDPYFSVFGEVVSGMDVVDSLTTEDMLITATLQGV